MGIVTVFRLILHVRRVNRDSSFFFFRCLVYLLIIQEGTLSGLCSESTFVIAAVVVVFPWSMWPIVPMLIWGFVLSNFCLAILIYPPH